MKLVFVKEYALDLTPKNAPPFSAVFPSKVTFSNRDEQEF